MTGVRPRGRAPARARARDRTRLRSPEREGGSVVAEFAVALPAVLLVLALVLGAARVVIAQVGCVDAARSGARAAARGEDAAVVRAAAAAAAPAGASVALLRGDGTVEVEVRSVQRLAGPLGGEVLVRSTATAAVEDPPAAGGGPPAAPR
ncbi:TadE family type IV pilus minor pilin [Kineococcus esterisolvens]|uniref:TadE family type IV pilus minor pilin n=1 Tax=unclassified Kineococcus TaxID=2621656 RepID=UPI003D7EF75F